MNEWVKVFDNQHTMEEKVNAGFQKGYKLVDFKMKISHGASGGASYNPAKFEVRYFVHMRKKHETYL